jgi:uncharacterized protein YerC
MKIKNKNTNNNIIYLDLGDLEDLVMKKQKPKKKKKRVDNKKKIVDEVKETLSIFDNLLKEAEEKKIKIPKELGELPINIEDINTIKELKALNEDLKQRIAVIRDLIQKTQPITSSTTIITTKTTTRNSRTINTTNAGSAPNTSTTK